MRHQLTENVFARIRLNHAHRKYNISTNTVTDRTRSLDPPHAYVSSTSRSCWHTHTRRRLRRWRLRSATCWLKLQPQVIAITKACERAGHVAAQHSWRTRANNWLHRAHVLLSICAGARICFVRKNACETCRRTCVYDVHFDWMLVYMYVSVCVYVYFHRRWRRCFAVCDVRVLYIAFVCTDSIQFACVHIGLWLCLCVCVRHFVCGLGNSNYTCVEARLFCTSRRAPNVFAMWANYCGPKIWIPVYDGYVCMQGLLTTNVL